MNWTSSHLGARVPGEVAAPRKRGRPRKKPPVSGGFTDPHVLAALDYCRKVTSGEIDAPRAAKGSCARQLRDLERAAADPSWSYEFSEALASRPCRFIEALPHVKGDLAGKRIRLEPWQAFVITTSFGWVRRGTNQRRFRRVTIYVPRGNGKSALSSGVGNYCLAADGESGAEVYAAATTREQARIVWDTARQMFNKHPHGTALAAKVGVTSPAAPTASSIYQAASGSTFRPLSREADNLDGLNIHCGILDELHAHKTREVYDVMETGTGKRTRSLLWVISTAGSDTSGIGHEVYKYARRVALAEIEDDALFAAIWEIDDGDDWTAESTWKKANPNWGVSVQPEVIAQLCRKAQQVASAQNAFLTKHLNQWVNADEAWMQSHAWEAMADPALSRDEFAGAPCTIGLDLASKTDIAAKVTLFWRDLEKEGGDAERHYYAFLDSFLPEAAVVDGRNASYHGWEIEGRLITTPGEVLDFGEVKRSVLDDASRFDVREVDYDPWQASQLSQELTAQGLPMVEMRPTVQNFSAPMKEMEALVRAGRFHHDGNPIFRWMVGNVVCHRDAKDNIYPRKEKPENKIDGVVAAIMALGGALAAAGNAKAYEGDSLSFV